LIGLKNACYLSSWYLSSSSLTRALTSRDLPRDPNHLDSLIRHHGSGCPEHWNSLYLSCNLSYSFLTCWNHYSNPSTGFPGLACHLEPMTTLHIDPKKQNKIIYIYIYIYIGLLYLFKFLFLKKYFDLLCVFWGLNDKSTWIKPNIKSEAPSSATSIY